MTSRTERLRHARTRRRRRVKLGAAALTATLAGLCALVIGGSGSTSAATPPAGGYLQILPPGSALPSDAQCAARVHRSAWEPRAENYAANHRVPPALHLAPSSAFNA